MALDRYSKLLLNNNKELRNRVVVPPMASETATIQGFVTETTLTHYNNLAESGAGLVMVEYSFVHESGRSEENQLGVNQDEQIEGLSKIANLIHQKGSLAGLQLTHAGGKTTRDLASGYLMTPSPVSVPVKDQQLEIGDPMGLSEIDIWKKSFLNAAVRGAKAGFDIIELHAAHGYGLNQWLSAITNLRTDQYGGNLLNRARLLFEIITEIKKALPKIIIAVRMPGQDFLEDGLSIDDTCVIAQELQRLGVAIIDVSSGIGGWRRPKERRGEGYLVAEAEQIQKAVSIPVIGVGGIENGSFIDDAVNTNKLSLAAVGRAILKSPQQWGQDHLPNQKEYYEHK